MGTSIELTIGGISLDWSKNSIGTDHGFLFQESDRTRRPSDQISYEYYAEHLDEDFAGHEAAFVRPLARVLPRLNLLGHTFDAARAEYEEVLAEAPEIGEFDSITLDSTVPDSRQLMTFEEFCAFVCCQPLSSLDVTFVDHDVEDRELRVKGRFINDAERIERIPYAGYSNSYWSERSYFAAITCILSAYSMLQIFGQSEENADAEVMWQYGPIVESG